MRGTLTGGHGYHGDGNGEAVAEAAEAAVGTPEWAAGASPVGSGSQCRKSAGATSSGMLSPRPLHARASTSAAAREHVVPTRMNGAQCATAAERMSADVTASARSWRASRLVQALKASRSAAAAGSSTPPGPCAACTDASAESTAASTSAASWASYTGRRGACAGGPDDASGPVGKRTGGTGIGKK